MNPSRRPKDSRHPGSSPAPLWEPLDSHDIVPMMALAQAVHASLPERAEVFAEKRALFPAGCRKLRGPRGEFLGYAVAHPWKLGTIPALDQPLGVLPDDPDCLYAHDMVVAPHARGSGASHACMHYWRDLAESLGLTALAGVSVYGTDVHWSRFGFRALDRPDLAATLATYGPTARYMVWHFGSL